MTTHCRASRPTGTKSAPIQGDVTMMRTPAAQTSRLLHAVRTATCLVLGISALPACSNILDVELPTQIVASTLDDPALANTFVQSAIADFECSYVNYAAATGTLGDEFDASTGFI